MMIVSRLINYTTPSHPSLCSDDDKPIYCESESECTFVSLLNKQNVSDAQIVEITKGLSRVFDFEFHRLSGLPITQLHFVTRSQLVQALVYRSNKI